MRTFVAVEIAEPIRRGIQAVRDRLAEVQANVRWVGQDNTHLTVKFIGNLSAGQVPEVCAALEGAAADVEPFDIEIRGVGTFPKRRPSVLWVGVDDPSRLLGRLHAAIENGLQKLGIKKEGRKFSPHITLGRVRGGKNIGALLQALDDEQPADLGTSRVTALVLFESKLTPQGPVYGRLAEIPLRGPRSVECGE